MLLKHDSDDVPLQNKKAFQSGLMRASYPRLVTLGSIDVPAYVYAEASDCTLSPVEV